MRAILPSDLPREALTYAGRLWSNFAGLGLVLGIPELMVERALPYLTVYSGQPQVNIFTAAPQVLAALITRAGGETVPADY